MTPVELQSKIEPDLEGVGSPDDEMWSRYPTDDILIRTEVRTVFEVVRRLDKTYVMNPDFQRDFVWDKKKQSKLIESVLMRIPLPVFYLAEDELGHLVVVDGLQRLSTFRDFLSKDKDKAFHLDLPREDLKGKGFDDLPAKLQNRVEDCNLTFYIIDSKVPERVRLDIFERVNLGVPLSRQQMRNCLYQGPATAFLEVQANSELFQRATGQGFRTRDMRDREAINRYCAFKIWGYDHYKGDFDDYLATALRHLNQNEGRLVELGTQLQRALSNAELIFGPHAFRKHEPEQNKRNPINLSVWDVMSTGLSEYSPALVAENLEALRQGFYDLLSDSDFQTATSNSTNSIKQVKTRYKKFQTYLKGVLGDADQSAT